jgi:vancomycin resistance protein VanJ
MVAGPVTGAEGDEQTGRVRPDLRVWSEFGIPAQRADETSSGADEPPPLAASGGDLEEPQGSPFTSARPPIGAGNPALPSAPMTPSQDPTTSSPTPSIPEQPMFGSSPSDTATSPFIPGQATAAAGESATAAYDVAPVVAEPELAPEQPQAAEPEARRRRLRSDRHSHRSRMRRQTSAGIVVLACLAVIFLVLHRFLPDAGGIGSLLETWLPWVGVPVLVLLIAAAVVHTKTALIVTGVAALVWTGLYGPVMLPRGSSAPAQLRIFSEDVNGNASEATASGTMALAQHAGVVALEDMYSSVYESSAVNALNAAYTNHVTEYEFGLWSNYPITNPEPITLGTTQSDESLSVGSQDAGLAASASAVPVIGALKATLTTPAGPLTVYLVHLPQPVVGDQGFAKARDQALTQFVRMLKTDHSARIAVIGDINVAATDRQFSQLTGADDLTSAQQSVGSGFGFTWPAEFPIVRLDDVLTRGLQPLRSVVLPAIAKGQTHLPIQVDLDY